MDTYFVLYDKEQMFKDLYYNSPVKTMVETASLKNGERFSLSPAKINSIGDLSTVSTGSSRREIQLTMDGRTALLTLWGKEADLEIVGDLYTIRCIYPTNDFNNQRCYTSTSSTTFEPYHDDQPDEKFEGNIESVSFERYLFAIHLLKLKISDNIILPYKFKTHQTDIF
ncbi:uncharacterized protein LOC144624737 [Crassostrea virginica]